MRFRYGRFAGFVIAVLLLCTGIGCAVNPVTGKRELMLLTESDEQRLGDQTDLQIAQTYGLYEDQALTAYVADIGGRLGTHTHRQGMTYRFKVLDSPVVNAFAVPGGYIYLTRGILSYFNNEAEMAGVLAHELGHVNARHTARNYSRAVLAQVGLGLGTALSEDFARYSGFVQFGVQMLFLSFSRADERQADDLGVEYSSRGGYDSNHMAAFFETLERLNPGSGSGLPAWFSTHPNPEDRVQAVRTSTAEWQERLALGSYRENRNDYLEKIDGLVYGEDPRQGFVRGNAFYHPALRFTFPVPGEWQVQNSPAQVGLLSPNRDAAVILNAAEGDSPEDAANRFYGQTGATVLSSESLTRNGYRAHRRVAEFVEEGTESGTRSGLHVISTFIQKGNTIFAFHGFTDLEHAAEYRSSLLHPMDQFRDLTDRDMLAVQPARLRIQRTTRREALGEALLRIGVAETDLESTAVLNGMDLGDILQPNTLLKILGR